MKPRPKSMKPRPKSDDAKKILKRLLKDYSVSCILELLAEMHYDCAIRARENEDIASEGLLMRVGGALEATAIGIEYIDPVARWDL